MLRIALVSPYAWSPPGGVTRHVAALAGELRARGHDVRVLAPGGGDVPLGGRTAGVRTNGAVSRLALGPAPVLDARRALRAWRPDVVHLHEPVAPAACWDLLGSSPAPLVGTFHCHSEARLPHALANLAGARRRLNRLHVRLAVSEAAAWTGRRFYGGTYRVVPNGVHVPAALAPRRAGGPVRLVFVGQAVERKGLAVALRAFEIVCEHADAELVVVGAAAADVAPLLLDGRGVRVLGPVGEAAKAAALRDADVLVAPSLGGESFGMVLTEAFAQGTPVVASDIAGYRDVVRPGRDGLLVAPGDAAALAAAVAQLAAAPARLAAMRAQASERAQRFTWPRVADEVLVAYDDARAIAARPARPLRRAAVAAGLRSADPDGHARPRRLPPPDAPAPGGARHDRARRRRSRPAPRRRLAALAGAAAAAGAAALAVDHVGAAALTGALLRSSPPWVLLALAATAVSMTARAGAWHALLRGAGVRGVAPRDALSATAVGVLLSATLPARLGEPARAVLVARRTGRARELLPVVAGTLVAQTLLNLLALALLAAVALGTVAGVAAREGALLLAAVVPLALAGALLAAPALPPLRAAAGRARTGLRALRSPRAGTSAAALQLTAWALQWLACLLVLRALGLQLEAGAAAAAAVLLAVNVTAALPATPSNVGVFQAACAAVLTGAHGVPLAEALAYGIVLQGVELATALALGVPALVREGVTWREARLRALSTAPAVAQAPAVARAPAPAGARP